MKARSPQDDVDFQSIFESVPGNYLILLPDAPVYTIVAVSDAYAAATLTEREQILCKGLFEVFPDNPEDPDATGVSNLSASLEQVLLHRLPHRMAIQKYDIPTGDDKGFEERYWSPLNTPVFGPGGAIQYVIHQVEDVTEKVKTADALETQTEELKRTNARLEQFVRVSSHDLQEPLRKIRTFADLLHHRCGNSIDKTALEMSRKMMESAEKMSARLKDLLAYTYLQREVAFIPIDLQEVFEEAKEELSLLIEEKQARINVEPLPVTSGIKHQLHQLFFNLLYNALKFSKEDVPPAIDITVRKRISPESGAGHSKFYHELIFTDNGIGFEQQYAERMFTVFERLQTGRIEAGTGMGLAFCKMVVENHGGSIRAYGEPGRGAKFVIMLPIV